MWTAIQLIICVAFLLAITFFIGRFFGKRKYLKLHEEMKALELSFNQVVEEMELASTHNIKVLEKQSEELAELLTIADRKILQINDFLAELDLSVKNLKKTERVAGNANSEAVYARKMKKELSELSDNISRQIEMLESQIFQIAQTVKDERCNEDKDSVNSLKLKSLIEAEVTRQISRQLEMFDQPEMPSSLDSGLMNKKKEVKTCKNDQGSKQKVKTDSGKISELRVSRFADNVNLPEPENGVQTQRPRPSIGSPVHEVLELAKNGITLPQIARQMGMGKGEIELILKIYGSEIEMRNVV